MQFLPVLMCKRCFHPIWLPPPTPPETSPNQTPWRWGNGPLNFACPACMQVFEYLAEDCHWGPIETYQKGHTALPVVHQLSLPCGVEQCAGLIHIHVIATEGLPRSEGPALAARLVAQGIKCQRGHISNGPSIGRGSIAFYPLLGF